MTTTNLAERVRLLRALQGDHPGERGLLEGTVLAYDRWQTEASGGTFLVVYDNHSEAFHKRHDQLSSVNAHNFGHSLDTPPLHECAAWHFAKALGARYERLLPATVYMKLDDEWGSVARRLPGAKPGTRAYLDADGKEQVNDAGFYDLLIGQQDRHLGNFMWDPATRRLGLFDHGFCFPATRDPQDRIRSAQLIDQRRQKAVKITADELALMERILNSGDLLGIEPLLEPARAAAMKHRIHRLPTQKPQIIPRVKGRVF